MTGLDTDRLEQKLATPGLRVLLLGESNYTRDFRQFAADLMNTAGEHGFTHLTLELRDSLQSCFDKYKYKGDRQELAQSLHLAGITTFDENLFDMLAAAARNAIEIRTIDETLAGRRFTGRDKKMAEQIKRIIAEPKNKVIHWGSYSRIYKRPGDLQKKPLTLAENLTENLAEDDNTVLSIMGVNLGATLDADEKQALLDNLDCFSPQYRGAFDSKTIEQRTLQALSDKRCSNGKCNLPFPCGCGKTENFDSPQPIEYGYWDYLWFGGD